LGVEKGKSRTVQEGSFIESSRSARNEKLKKKKMRGRSLHPCIWFSDKKRRKTYRAREKRIQEGSVWVIDWRGGGKRGGKI